MSHTPGPWTIDKAWYSAVNGNGGKKHIAMVNFYKCPDKDVRIDEAEHEANARLIASAPDLLEVCEELIYHMTHSLDCKHGDGFTYDFCPVEKARAAIAKARGEV